MKRINYSLALGLISLSSFASNVGEEPIHIPSIKVNHQGVTPLSKAYRIAIGDVSGNIQYHKSGILETESPCLYAGLAYDKPWTRDASINIWNGFVFISPEISKNTLLAQVGKDSQENYEIIGQYWDKVIWSIGAWEYYKATGDKKFLKIAYSATQNTILTQVKLEYDKRSGLFRGPAVYGDGVSAYTKIYTKDEIQNSYGTESAIYEWPDKNPSLRVKKGYGIPMEVLSTNCVYVKTYQLLSLFENELGIKNSKEWNVKANTLKKAINKNLWNKEEGRYNYYIDPFGGCDYQESMGLSFALLFDIANEKQKASILSNIHIEPAGIPAVYPSFPRYRNKSRDSYGRHSGNVWPHIQGFWADAALKEKDYNAFDYEFNQLTEHANRDFQFVEIYHPTTGKPYGGMQEPVLDKWQEWFCGERQSWSATAYIRMVLRDIVGLSLKTNKLTFTPYLPKEVHDIDIKNLHYKEAILDISIHGEGNSIKLFSLDGKTLQNAEILGTISKGNHTIEIEIKP